MTVLILEKMSGDTVTKPTLVETEFPIRALPR